MKTLRSLGRWLALVLLGCSSTTHPPPVTDAGAPDAGMSEAQALALRTACTFAAGALPSQTLAASSPLGAQIPINHVLLVMQENRSFDQIFDGLADAGAQAGSALATNPDGTGGQVPRYHDPQYCVSDTNHSWAGAHQEWDEGANDGFVLANDPDGGRAMGYYEESDLPLHYALARSFATSDMHFCSVLGPTWPNRMYFFGGTSWGETDNIFPPIDDPQGHPYQNLFTALADAGVTWKVYSESAPSAAMLLGTYAAYLDQYVPLANYYADLDAGTLPQVAWIEPNFGTGANQDDEHPPGDVQLGETFFSNIVGALMASSAWDSSAMFITYDENGGLYDSVPPPPACAPDAIPPLLAPGDPDAGFDRYGFRVPLIVVSPYVKPGYVSHVVSDHTSLMRFVEARFNLSALTGRDANADALLDFFDFAHPQPAPSLPAPLVDSTRLMQCIAQFPSQSNSP